ncbi:MAG: hypothetical protein HY335_01895 [Deinococcus sp.]|nr:hypothetical protein [Deinococcus sp.]
MYVSGGTCSTNFITFLGISGIPVIVIALTLVGGTVAATPVLDLGQCALSEEITATRVPFVVSACEVLYANAHLEQYTGWLSQAPAGERLEYIQPKLIADLTGLVGAANGWDQARTGYLFDFAFWDPAHPAAVYFRDGDAILASSAGVIGPVPTTAALGRNVVNLQLVVVDISQLGAGADVMTAAAQFMPTSEWALHGGPWGDHERLGHRGDFDGGLGNGEVGSTAIVDIIDTTLYLECLVARVAGEVPQFTAADFYLAPASPVRGS